MGGVALGTLYYPSSAARSAADTALLVNRLDALRALECSWRIGWRWQTTDPPWALLASAGRVRVIASGAQSLGAVLGPGRSPPSRSGRPALGGSATLRDWRLVCADARAADQLVQVCTNTVERWCGVPPLLWVADAVLLLRSASDLSWERAVERAERAGVADELVRALEYLGDRFEAPAPGEVLEAIAHHRTIGVQSRSEDGAAEGLCRGTPERFARAGAGTTGSCPGTRDSSANLQGWLDTFSSSSTFRGSGSCQVSSPFAGLESRRGARCRFYVGREGVGAGADSADQPALARRDLSLHPRARQRASGAWLQP